MIASPHGCGRRRCTGCIPVQVELEARASPTACRQAAAGIDSRADDDRDAGALDGAAENTRKAARAGQTNLFPPSLWEQERGWLKSMAAKNLSFATTGSVASTGTAGRCLRITAGTP